MIDRLYERYSEVWVWDSEFVPVSGWRVIPVCMAATELRSGTSRDLWLDQAGQRAAAPVPFPIQTCSTLFTTLALS